MSYQFLRFPEGKAKAVTFSYDDGCIEDIRMADTLAKYGLKGTFNLTASPRLTKEEIETHLLGQGHEIAVHGATHKAEGLARPIEGIRDVLDCRLFLEKTFGRIVRGMAYPDSGICRMMHGASYEGIRQYLAELQIAYARTLGGDNDRFELPTDWYAWMPSAHHDNPQIMEYIRTFLEVAPDHTYGARKYPRLLYIWGHSYEFERKQNWEHLEDICREISGKDDIWYATNMEIYQYVRAYEALEYSADGTLIYNPTLTKVWFCIQEKPYTIAPGEILHITEEAT